MNVTRRIAKLESFHRVGPDADGACGYCRGRERELGKVVVVYDPPREPEVRFGPVRPQPGPTPCPRCGRDMNVTIVVRRVDLLSKQREETGFKLERESR